MNGVEQLHPQKGTRRWPRYPVELPVRIIALNGVLTTPVSARCTEISRAGMALHAPVALNPGDQMQLQFPTSQPSRVSAVIRNRRGSCFGLEFLSQLPPDEDASPNPITLADRPGTVTKPQTRISRWDTRTMVETALRRKQEEFKQLQKEIEVLSVAILLLAENEKEICRLPLPQLCHADVKPWPQLS